MTVKRPRIHTIPVLNWFERIQLGGRSFEKLVHYITDATQRPSEDEVRKNLVIVRDSFKSLYSTKFPGEMPLNSEATTFAVGALLAQSALERDPSNKTGLYFSITEFTYNELMPLARTKADCASRATQFAYPVGLTKQQVGKIIELSGEIVNDTPPSILSPEREDILTLEVRGGLHSALLI